MNAILPLLALGGLGPTTETFTIDGVQRQALVFAPTKKTTHPPMVFGWHGHGGAMTSCVNMYNFQTAWPEAVVVYPQGLPSPAANDPQGLKNGFQWRPGESGDRDLKLFDAMRKKIGNDFSVDPKRVYTMGFSNGGMFSYLLWSQRHGQFGAVGIIEGAVMPEDKPLKPMAAFVAAGKKDNTCPYADQAASIRYDRQVDGVAPNAMPQMMNGVRFFHGEKADLAVMIHEGGHEYPSGTTPKLVRFFKAHPKS